MTTRSAAALLNIALQDLHAGKRALRERLPGIAAHTTDDELRAILATDVAQAASQAERIEGAGVSPGSQRNLWMEGILDDAERDTSQVQPGRLLDIALIGAIRKAKASEIVSSETALALANETDIAELHTVVTQNRDEDIATDRALKRRLAALTRQP